MTATKPPYPRLTGSKKVWTARTVNENSTLVYTKGTTGNIRNYGAFRLDLSQPPAVSFTDYDGVTFTGQYELPTDTRLVLKGLSPAPTSTGGTIEFTINAVGDSQLDLTPEHQQPQNGRHHQSVRIDQPLTVSTDHEKDILLSHADRTIQRFHWFRVGHHLAGQ